MARSPFFSFLLTPVWLRFVCLAGGLSPERDGTNCGHRCLSASSLASPLHLVSVPVNTTVPHWCYSVRHTCARLGRDSFLQIGKCFGSRACSGNGEERETPSKQARRVQDVDILPPNVAGYQILYRSTVPAPPVSALPSSWWRSALPTGGEQTGFGLGRVSCASARLRHLHLLEPFKAAKQLSAGTLSAGLSLSVHSSTPSTSMMPALCGSQLPKPVAHPL